MNWDGPDLPWRYVIWTSVRGVQRTWRPFGSGGDQPPERSVSDPLCGQIDPDLGWASGMGEARVAAAEAASQVVVEDGGTDLEEELSSGR
jgi:hypothetical protein